MFIRAIFADVCSLVSWLRSVHASLFRSPVVSPFLHEFPTSRQSVVDRSLESQLILLPMLSIVVVVALSSWLFWRCRGGEQKRVKNVNPAPAKRSKVEVERDAAKARDVHRKGHGHHQKRAKKVAQPTEPEESSVPVRFTNMLSALPALVADVVHRGCGSSGDGGGGGGRNCGDGTAAWYGRH